MLNPTPLATISVRYLDIQARWPKTTKLPVWKKGGGAMPCAFGARRDTSRGKAHHIEPDMAEFNPAVAERHTHTCTTPRALFSVGVVSLVHSRHDRPLQGEPIPAHILASHDAGRAQTPALKPMPATSLTGPANRTPKPPPTPTVSRPQLVDCTTTRHLATPRAAIAYSCPDSGDRRPARVPAHAWRRRAAPRPSATSRG